MKRLGIALGLLLLFLVIIFASFGSIYNDLVRSHEEVKAAFAEIDNQLKRRQDLIPNYVKVVKGYVKHEEKVFIEVAKARQRLASAKTFDQKIKADLAIRHALSSLFLIVERYPELKADRNFIRLQDELAGTENRIAVARRRYNEAVKVYNAKIKMFPQNILARIFGFKPEPFYKIEEREKKLPEINF